MSKNKQDQTARRRATQDVIAANRSLFEERMRHYYEEMGLGTWSPRLSAEERAALKAEQEKEAAAVKIRALAEKAGIGVLLVEDPLIEEKIKAVHDGTAEPGVTIDWDRPAEEQPYRDEEAATLAEHESGEDEEALAEQRRRDEDADAAENVAQASQF